MAVQTFETHAHRPIATGIGYLCLVIAIAGFALRWFMIGGRYTMALGLAGLIGANLVLLQISRLYITRLQDRIIRTEMRLRATSLLTPEQQTLLSGLTMKQIVALRFASDAELPVLVERAAREQLPPAAIKRAIRNWVADLDRT
jgi:predicted phage-related endonuclease